MWKTKHKKRQAAAVGIGTIDQSWVDALIDTTALTNQLKQGLKRHNAQYPAIKLKTFNKAHDRFLIIDQKKVYHIGAPLKDLGRGWFAFSRINLDAAEMMKRLNAK